MFAVDKALHSLAMLLSGVVTQLLPDRIPVTFVGNEATRELCSTIGQMGAQRALIVTDEGLVKVGIPARVEEALGKAGVEATIYAGVEPDPTTAQVEAGFAQLEAEGCDAVVAVGGGSCMDAAKVIAALATNRVPVARLEGPMKVKRAPMALYAIPTTAGTGSEVTVAAVISAPTSHAKKFIIDPKLLPRATALDPTLMLGLPPLHTAATGMDALTHAVESYLSRTSNATTESYASLSARLVFENLPEAYANGDGLEARKAMALASYYGGLAFTRTSVGYVHAIAHTFGAFYGTPHGLANAIALPHVLEFSAAAAAPRLARLADLVGVGSGADDAKAADFIAAVRALMDRIEIPQTLDALQTSDIPAIAKQALAEAHLSYPVPRYMSQPECESLLRQMVA